MSTVKSGEWHENNLRNVLISALLPYAFAGLAFSQTKLPCFASMDDFHAYVAAHPPHSQQEGMAYGQAARAIRDRGSDVANPCGTPVSTEAKPAPSVPLGPSFRTITVNGRILTAADGTPVGPGSDITAGLPFGDARPNAEKGVIYGAGKGEPGKGGFVVTYGANADPLPSISFRWRLNGRGGPGSSDLDFHGWAADGTAYVEVADAIADQVTVGSNGVLYPSGQGTPFPAGVTSAGSLYRKKMKVHPDYSYEFIAVMPPGSDLWIPRIRGDHMNNDQVVEKLDSILKHNGTSPSAGAAAK